MSQFLFLDSVLTRPVGRCDSSNDSVFNDVHLSYAILVVADGEFPGDPKIKGIKQIDVFSDKKAGDDAVITGLTIIYDGVDKPVSHGMVVNMKNVGTLTIDPKKALLVGVYGRLKDLSGDQNDKRIASISFVVFEKRDGKVETKGPYQGATEYLGAPWVTVGPVVALHGTTKDGIGLTTLGFVKGWRKGDEDVEIL